MPPSGKAGRRRWIRVAVLGGAIVGVAAVGLLAIPRATEAAACDYWIGGNGNFSTASNWSTGAVPNTAADACITQTTSSTPPAAADTYTVLVDSNVAVGTLNLGGASGTQTLQVAGNSSQFLINTIGTINSNGVLLVGDNNVLNGYSLLAAGGSSSLLTNSGLIRTVQGGGGTRLIRINLTNAAGTVDIAAADTRQDFSSTTTNNGTFTVETGAGFAISAGSFVNQGGSVTNNGAFSQTGGTFMQRGGSETGNPVLLQAGGLDDDLGAAPGNFTISCPNCPPYPLTGTGAQPGVAAGQVVTIPADNTQVNLSVASFTNAGTITLGAGTGHDVLCCSSVTLTNTGHLNTVQGGADNRYLRLNVNNAGGVVDIAAPTLQDVNGTTFTNNGTLTVEPGNTFYVSGGATLTQGAGGIFQTTIDANVPRSGQLNGGGDVISLDGRLKVITVGHPAVGSSWPIISNANRSGTFAIQDFGGFNYAVQYPAGGVTLVAQANCDTWIGGVNSDFGTAGNWSFGAAPTSADDACITATTTTIPQATADTYSVILSGGQSVHSVTLGGPNGTQTLMMPANGAQLTLGADSTINANGIFTLGDTGTGDNTLCCAGVLLTNSGHLNTVGATGNRNVRVNIANAAGGTLDIAAKNSLQDNTTTTTNNGTVTIEASGGLGLANSASFINAGGSVTNSGAFSLNGSRFTQRAGTESGTPVYFFNGSTLDDDVSAGAGLFTFLNSVDTVTGTGATPGIAAGQVLTIGAGNDTQGTLGVNLTNAGTIVMGDAGAGYTSLCCAANTLTNIGHLNTIQGGGGTRYLRANILNASAGSIDVAATSTFQDGATTTTNNGAVTIEAGGGLGVFGPGSFINSGGSVTNNSAFSINSSAVFVQRGGTESGTPVYLQTGSTLDDDLNAGAAQFIMNCPSCIVHLTGTGPTPGVAAGQVLTIPANKTEVDLGVNLTNAGTIVLGDAGTDISILCGSGVTLTNTGQLNTILGGGGASNVNRYLRVNINNAIGGSIDIAFSTFSDGVMCAGGVGPAPTTITNNGTVMFEGGGLWLLSGAYTQTAGATLATTVDVNNPSIPITRMSGGPVNLDGKLKVTTVGTPLTNSRWVIIHGTIGAGRFASFNRGGIGYQIDYSSTDVTLVVRPIRPYHPVAPARILDTRPGSQVGPYSTPLGPQETRDVQVTGQGGVPAGASAVVVNVTVTNTTGASFLTVFPTGVTRPVASNLNWTAGKTVPNLVQVALGTGGKLSIYNQVGTTDVVIDVAGYIDAPTVTAQPDGLYHPVVPDRVLDTRSGNGAPQAQVGPGHTITVQMTGRGGSGIPAAGVSAVVLNVTVTNATAASYLTVWPEGVQQPVASNLNFLAGQNTPNRVIVKLGSTGKVSFYNAAGSVDVIADVGGWFTDATPDGIGSTFTGLTPARILDTRPQSQVGPFSTPFAPRQTRNVAVAGQGFVPSMNSTPQPTAVVLNVTVTNPTAPSFLTVWPSDAASQPTASDLNYVASQTSPNLVVVRLGADGSISLYNAAGSTDVIIDVVGYYN